MLPRGFIKLFKCFTKSHTKQVGQLFSDVLNITKKRYRNFNECHFDNGL